MAFCTSCGKELREGDSFCANCGARVVASQSTPTPPTGQQAVLPMKNPGAAALWAALPGFIGIWGIGHIYLGKVGEGVIWLIVGVVLGFVSLILAVTIIGLIVAVPIWIAMFIIWIVLIFSARNAAMEYNDEVQETGQAPW